MKKIILSILLFLAGCVNVIPLEEMEKDNELQFTKKLYENIQTNKELTNEINTIEQIVNKYDKNTLNETDIKNLLKELNIKSTNYKEIRDEIREKEKNLKSIISMLEKREEQKEQYCSKYLNKDKAIEKKYIVFKDFIPYEHNKKNAKKNFEQCISYINNENVHKMINKYNSIIQKSFIILGQIKYYYRDIEVRKENKITGNINKCGDISENIATSIFPGKNTYYHKECIYDFVKWPFTTVLQSLEKGALISFYMPDWGNTIIKIDDDEEYIDGNSFKGRNYVYTGNYKYTTVLGSTKTIASFKKLNIEKLKLPKTYFYEGLNYVP